MHNSLEYINGTNCAHLFLLLKNIFEANFGYLSYQKVEFEPIGNWN